MVADRFEAREGWVPANTEGSVWCYRARGNAGVLAFRRTEEGECLYEATHQDCYASDETITTARRVDAVHFAVAGNAAASEAAASPPVSGDTPSEVDGTEPPPGSSRAGSGDRDALRAAWQRYMHATSELLKHLEANLDAARGELRDTVDQALALIREGALEPAATGAGEVDRLSAAIGAALREAHELIAATETGERAEH